MARNSRTVLPRRMVLRGMLAGGVSVAVPLPRLFGMLNDNGTAYAAGAPLPVRFGTWFFGNGIIPNRWVPPHTGTGTAWQLSEELAPLQDVKPWLNVLTGFSIKISNNAPHASMPCCALTGAQVGGQNVQSPSIDQLVAKVTSAGTTFPNGLHVGISNKTGASALGLSISYSAANSPNQPNYSPANLFTQLMKVGGTPAGGSTTPMPVDPEILNRGLVLDAVAEDAKSLRLRLGADDQKRLDLHLSGLSQLQNQVKQAQMGTPIKLTTATLVDPDKAYQGRGADGVTTRQRSQAFADLLVFAMAADITRVFSFVFTCAACHDNYADAGLDTADFHESYGHRLNSKGLPFATASFNTGVKYAMTNYADLLTRMRNTPDGAGNLLDNSCVYATSCVSESQTHGGTDYPLLVAGKAGGKLRTDQHIRIPDANVTEVPFTLLKAMGSTAASFGLADGMASTGVSGMLA